MAQGDSKPQIMSNLLNGTFEFVHVTLKERKVREEKVLELGVFFLVGREHENDTDCDLLLPGNTQTRPAVLVRHVEALLHRPGRQKRHWKCERVKRVAH